MSSLGKNHALLRRDRVFDFMLPNPVYDPELDTSHGPLLYVEDISVSFDGFKALNNLTLYIDNGELRCIIGPNGAGKTTMMDVITGKTRPDSGSVYFGQRIDLLRYDEPTIAQADKRVWPTLFARLTGEQKDHIEEVMEIIGLQERYHTLAGSLSHGQKQWLEIGMLLMQQPKLLLVDEPVAGMTHQETERTAELLLSLAGKHVVVVEHDMEFVRSIASKVTVLHEGSVLAEGPMADVQNDPRVIEVYLGE